MKRLTAVLLTFCLLLPLSSCGSASDSADANSIQIYYLGSEGDELQSREYQITSTQDMSDTETVVAEAVAALIGDPNDEELTELLPDGVTMQNFSIKSGVVTVDFSKEYSSMDTSRNVLIRAAFVRTLTQIEGVRGVSFTVNRQPLTDSFGNEIGTMTANSFVEQSGENVNAYKRTTLTLYYTDSSGKVLIPETRQVYYNSNEPLEKVVVDEIIAGPEEAGNYPTLDPSTNVLSVIAQDGTCFVNFDKSVDNTVLNVEPETAIYSIVNSLMENCQVNAVQFSINGETNVKFRGMVSLDGQFTMNEDLIAEQ